MTVYLCALLCALCAIVIYVHFARRSNGTVKLVVFNKITRFLQPNVSLAHQLRRRALANVRLKTAFGINSTFVNGDVLAHTAFTKNAIQLISPRRLPLRHLAEIAQQTTALYVREGTAFDTAIRRLTMHVILVGLLSDFVDESAISVNDLDLVTVGINDLWTLSKSSTYRPELLEAVNARLRLWLPTYANPLEIIIPTYETMWRVVAIAVALAHDNPHTPPVFTRLLQEPTHEQYREVIENSFSADNFMQEVLRLYPPTRRISRVVSISSFPILSALFPRLFTRSVTIAADIEALQRDSIWGNSRGEFNPVRHQPQLCTEQQSNTLLAFGAGKLACVAKNWAPQAAAIITAAFLDQVGHGKGLAVEAGRAIGGRGGWEGWSVRKNAGRLHVNEAM